MDSIFSHLFGQELFKEQMVRLWQEKRLPHTCIFYGEEGLGKTTAAFEVAALVTGASSQLWQDIASWGSDFDTFPVVTAAEEGVWYLHPLGMELKMEQFRIFLEAMTSFDDRPRVCIIDEAQTMKAEVANSLLKTLEEPAGEVYFILVTHDIHALLPTILSRGEKFPFFPLHRDAYHELLVSDKEKYKLPPGVTEELAYQMSEGNPGVTLDMGSEEGEPEPDRAMRFWETITYKEMSFSELALWRIGERRDFSRLLRWILLVGRDIMILSDIPHSSLIRCRQVEDRMRKVAPYWDKGRSERAIAVLQKAMLGCRRYISVKNIWDMILIELHHIQRGIT